MSYDFIVVGSGSSSCALVNKLHELCPDKSILILEAGGSNEDQRVRDFTRAMETYDAFGWNINSIPQALFNNREMPYLSGRINGGSGSINGMVCVKPHPHDELMKHVNKSSINEVCSKLKPTDIFTHNEPSKHTMDAFLKKGFLYTNNYLEDGEASEKLSYPRLNISDKGERLDPYSVFVSELIGQNVAIINNALVQKLIIDEKNNVQGVRVLINGREEVFHAKCEVILCAGAIYTPQILLKSGIGPRDTLTNNDIFVLKDLPVGKNLHDQLMIYSVCSLKKEAFDLVVNQIMNLTGFFRYDNFNFDSELNFKPIDNNRQPEFQLQTYPIKDGWGNIPPYSFVLCIIVLHPKSRGVVSLDNQRVFIDPKCGSDSSDFSQLLNALKIAMGFMDILPADLYGKRILPAGNHHTDDELMEYIKETAITNHHPGGTCKIGHVTNKDFNVIGINKLRIADSSIIPSPVSGNPQIAACALGIQAAKVIASSYNAKILPNIDDAHANLTSRDLRF
ncbi:MAG: GMC family oxidoreductase [Legionella sp.]|uniref:GMC family oxidoreductase n=1 Tax=Legionella sp. TaxID=459 RepID=UPI00283B7716|nr:GMC family oxidoreductase [Legionella sp.]